MGKFIDLYEKVYQRYENTSAIPGDYITLRNNIKSSDWYKSLDQSQKVILDNISKMQSDDIPVMLQSIKSNQYNTNVLGASEYYAVIAVEEAPGYFTHKITVPMDLVEFKMTSDDNRASRTNKTYEYKPKINHTPEPAKDQEYMVGNNTKIDKGDYKLAGENYTLNYMS